VSEPTVLGNCGDEMAQPNLAREPSMEEILASIRRIIESNDPGSDAAGLHSAPTGYSDDDIEDAEDVSFDPELVANDPGMPVQPQSVAADPFALAASAERSLSLADVAARVRAASVRQQEMAMLRPVPRAEEPPARSVEPVEFPTASISSRSLAPSALLQDAPSDPAPFSMPELRPTLGQDREAARPSVIPFAEKAEVEPTPAAADVASPQLPEPPQLPVQLDAQIGAMAGLLSESAGAQVAKSFGELADVFDGLERRSVEEMAQDMLRPMLQEWLDDNLPTLVERLVREEIERVARGPRR
jgi:cell pole-organizing protein PopZ